MEIRDSKPISKSNKNFMLLLIAAVVLFATFATAYFKTTCVGISEEETESKIQVAADEGTIYSPDNETSIDALDLDSIDGIYIAGYNDFEILTNSGYTKLNLIDESFIVDAECERIVNLLALAAIKLDKNQEGYYYNIQPAITDLYGGSKEVELKEITEFYNFSPSEILASEVIIDKTNLSVSDALVQTSNDLLPDGCRLEQKAGGVLVLTIPQYQERITFRKVNIKID